MEIKLTEQVKYFDRKRSILTCKCSIHQQIKISKVMKDNKILMIYLAYSFSEVSKTIKEVFFILLYIYIH